MIHQESLWISLRVGLLVDLLGLAGPVGLVGPVGLAGLAGLIGLAIPVDLVGLEFHLCHRDLTNLYPSALVRVEYILYKKSRCQFGS